MMNFKGFVRKQSWPNFKVLSWYSSGGTEENHKKRRSGELVAAAEISTKDLPIMKQAGVLTTQP
jgi:hypothetical protein